MYTLTIQKTCISGNMQGLQTLDTFRFNSEDNANKFVKSISNNPNFVIIVKRG